MITEQFLKEKVKWVTRETLEIHYRSQETRIASSLSDIEIFVALFYGGLLKFDPKRPDWEDRDRFIVSKGHGAISMYPILADLGYFDKEELQKVCREGALLGGIPDANIPGFETTNGSLGHGLGVSCGVALGLRQKKSESRVFTLLSDGELFEGAVWEAIMFAPEHRLDNLIAVVDHNRVAMLDYCKNIIDLSPLAEKIKSFRWQVEEADGHDVMAVHRILARFREERNGKPKMLVANTIKGKGVPKLQNHPLCHILSLSKEEIEKVIGEIQ